jgi:uncharacterized protein
VLSAFAPWAVTPLLMLGGAYLCFEAAEKILEALRGEVVGDEVDELALSSEALEKEKVSGAIRTDLILSAEIMAISLAEVAGRPLAIQAAALAVVALAMTVGVYGVVGLIVKMDDIGLHMAGRKLRSTRAVGEALVRGMPVVLDLLTRVGTVAMLWVGGGILVHGLHEFGVHGVPEIVDAAREAAGSISVVGPVTGWLAQATLSALVGLIVGGLIALAYHRLTGGKGH